MRTDKQGFLPFIRENPCNPRSIVKGKRMPTSGYTVKRHNLPPLHPLTPSPLFHSLFNSTNRSLNFQIGLHNNGALGYTVDH